MFTFTINSYLHHRLLQSALLLAIVALVSAQRPAHAVELPTNNATEVDVTFTLSIPVTDVNQFEISGELDTLTASLGTVSASGSAQIEGQIEATLYFQTGFETELPLLTGIEIRSSNLQQSPLSLSYNLPTGPVQFSTSELSTQLESTTAGGLIPISLGEFQAADLQLVQHGGTASVSVPARRLEQQDLADTPVASLFNLRPNSVSEASIALAALEANEFEVELRIPLNGQVLEFPHVGLPVDLEFQSGVLQATGRFQLATSEIPEPSTLLLALLALGGGLCARGRR